LRTTMSACVFSRCTDLKDNMPSSGNILEEQLRDLFNEVHAMIRIGKENEARDLLLANFEAVKEQIDAGHKGIEEAAILDVTALGYMALGDIRTVKPLLDVVILPLSYMLIPDFNLSVSSIHERIK